MVVFSCSSGRHIAATTTFGPGPSGYCYVENTDIGLMLYSQYLANCTLLGMPPIEYLESMTADEIDAEIAFLTGYMLVFWCLYAFGFLFFWFFIFQTLFLFLMLTGMFEKIEHKTFLG